MAKLFISLAAFFSIFMTAAAFEVASYFPPETKLIAKLDLEKLRANKFSTRIKEKHQDKIQVFEDKFLNGTGIDIQNIKTIWLAGVEQGNGILIFEGSFDRSAISEAVSRKPENQAIEKNGCMFAVMCPGMKDKTKKNLAALIDESIIVVGKPDLADKFIENYSGKTAGLDENTIKIFSEPKVFKAVLLSISQEMIQKKPFMADVQSGSFEMDLDDHALLNLQINTSNKEQAEAVKQILDGMVKLNKTNKASDEKRVLLKNDFLNNLEIDCTGNSVIAQSSINGQTLDKIIEMGK